MSASVRRIECARSSNQSARAAYAGSASGDTSAGRPGRQGDALMLPVREDFLRILPEIILCLTGILVMVIEPFLSQARRAFLVSLAGGGAVLGLLATMYPSPHLGPAFSGLLRIDAFSVFFHVLIGLIALLAILASSDYLEREHI